MVSKPVGEEELVRESVSGNIKVSTTGRPMVLRAVIEGGGGRLL